MATLDEQEAAARDRQPAPELTAAEVAAYLRDLPRLWDDAPDSRRGLAASLFERVEVLGLRRMHLEPTPAAVAAGLVDAFSSASAGSGRGERDSASLTQRSLRFLMVNATPREPSVPLELVRSA